jgi:hypothetical protein
MMCFMYIGWKLIENDEKMSFLLANLEYKFYESNVCVPFEYRHLSLGLQFCMHLLHVTLFLRRAFNIKPIYLSFLPNS